MKKKIIGIFVIILFIEAGIFPSVIGNAMFEKKDLCIVTPGPYFGIVEYNKTFGDYDIYEVQLFFIFLGSPSLFLLKGKLVALLSDDFTIRIGSVIFCLKGTANIQ